MIRLFFIILLQLFIYPDILLADASGILFKEKDYTFPYDLSAPDQIQKLPSKLNEISGISYMGDKKFIGVQDEKGAIYFINFNNGDIDKKISFAEDADFEGITIVGSTAWVLKSSGDLYEVVDFEKEEEKTESIKYENELSKKNNTEGLTFDQDNNRLLIACKDFPFLDKDKKGKRVRTIYEFNLETKSLNPTPVYTINIDQIKEFRKHNLMAKLGIKILSKLDRDSGDVTFQPSDLAIHPITKNIYVIGSVGDLLVILNPDGHIIALVDLADKLFNQPEGICFDENGTLYISNEGEEKKATILEFIMND